MINKNTSELASPVIKKNDWTAVKKFLTGSGNWIKKNKSHQWERRLICCCVPPKVCLINKITVFIVSENMCGFIVNQSSNDSSEKLLPKHLIRCCLPRPEVIKLLQTGN